MNKKNSILTKLMNRLKKRLLLEIIDIKIQLILIFLLFFFLFMLLIVCLFSFVIVRFLRMFRVIRNLSY